MEQLCVHEAGPVCAATVSGDDRRGSKAKRRRKYIFSDQIDHLIREIYLSPPKTKTRPGIRLLSKKVGMPHWALKKRARELGLARTKELSWSERELQILARYAWMSDERIRLKLKAAGYARTVTGIHLKLKRMKFKHDGSFRSELQILARYAWMSDERIRLKLKAAGYARTVTGIHLKLKRMKFKHDGSFRSELQILARYAWMSDERIRLKLKAAGYARTVTGIHLKLKRMKFKHDGSFYSASGLAQALGIDSHAVTRWIKSGHLKAKCRGTARTEQQNGISISFTRKTCAASSSNTLPISICAKWISCGSSI